MKNVAITLTAAAATLLAATAFAQSGEVSAPVGQNAPKATAQEKAAGKATRKAAGRAAAQDAVHAKGATGEAAAEGSAPAMRLAKDERKAASIKRKAEVKDAQKRGEIPTGEAPVK